jgi:copper(I)-binding protein
MKTWIHAVAACAIITGAVLGAAACGGDDNKAGDKTGVATAPAAPKTVSATPSAPAGISVKGAWARKSAMSQGGMMAGDQTAMAGENGAAYMVIANGGSADDAIIGIESTVANATELHESMMNGDIVTMKPVARLDITAGASVELKPGSYHIMFIGLKQPLQVGAKITLTLKFEKAGPMKVEAEVREE